MGNNAEQAQAACWPPRRGAVWAVTVDSTARAYDLSKLPLGGYTPEASNAKRNEVVLYLQAETNDVYFYFDSATGIGLNDATLQAAGAGAATFADAYGAILEAGGPPLKVRISRSLDKFIQLKAASTSGILRMWAGSPGE